jgi:hypothetical protein
MESYGGPIQPSPTMGSVGTIKPTLHKLSGVSRPRRYRLQLLVLGSSGGWGHYCGVAYASLAINGARLHSANQEQPL